MFGCEDVFVAAAKLESVDGVTIKPCLTDFTYVHFMLDDHAVVFANGYPCETYLGDPTKDIISADVDQTNHAPGQHALLDMPCHLVPCGKLQRKLVARQIKNGKPFCSSVQLATTKRWLSGETGCHTVLSGFDRTDVALHV